MFFVNWVYICFQNGENLEKLGFKCVELWREFSVRDEVINYDCNGVFVRYFLRAKIVCICFEEVKEKLKEVEKWEKTLKERGIQYWIERHYG